VEKTHRKIIHIDMDAFFASVEQLDNPELIGKPIAVGGSAQRGVIAAASYEARKFGVRSAMSSVLAKRKCPQLIFVKSRFNRYKEISQQIRQIFYEYTNLVEPLSLDEAFLDVTSNKKGIELASDIATEINKPNGQKIIHPTEVEKFLEKLPIHKFFGIGKVTSKKMNDWGIYTGYDLKQQSLAFLSSTFGKQGQHYYNIVRGIHHSPVKPNRERKSVGVEHTFAKNITSESFIVEKLNYIADEVLERLQKANKSGRTITVKIKFSDFTVQTRSKTTEHFITTKEDMSQIIQDLIYQEEIKKSVRLLGVSISNFNQPTINKKESIQLEFNF
jgi:DNA polymerase-4